MSLPPKVTVHPAPAVVAGPAPHPAHQRRRRGRRRPSTVATQRARLARPICRHLPTAVHPQQLPVEPWQTGAARGRAVRRDGASNCSKVFFRCEVVSCFPASAAVYWQSQSERGRPRRSREAHRGTPAGNGPPRKRSSATRFPRRHATGQRTPGASCSSPHTRTARHPKTGRGFQPQRTQVSPPLPPYFQYMPL